MRYMQMDASQYHALRLFWKGIKNQDYNFILSFFQLN